MRGIVFLAGLFAAVTVMAEPGHWRRAPNGFPVYAYTGRLPVEVDDDRGGDSNLPEDPYFLLGNYRMGLFVHVSGVCQFMTAQRAWARVNACATRPDYGDYEASIEMAGSDGPLHLELVGVTSLAADPSRTKREFGIGYARYSYDLPLSLSCDRVVSVRPSEEINGGVPAFVVSVTLRNDGSVSRKVTYEERMPVRYVTMQTQMQKPSERPVSYPIGMTCSSDGKSAIAHVSARSQAFLVLPEKSERFPYEMDPADVFLSVPGKDPLVRIVADSSDNRLKAHVAMELSPGASKTFHLIWGLLDGREYRRVGTVCEAVLEGVDLRHSENGLFAANWERILPAFTDEKDGILRRELLWNAHVVEASAKYSEYFQETFIPQGSVYSYHYGDNIANRDHLQAMLPACYTHPQLAKSALRYVLKHTDTNGEIKRGNLGFGYTPPIIYKESDQQLYLFQSVAEYLRITGDYDFLDEYVEFYPAEYGKRDRIITMLERHFVYLRDEIGLGPNGLVKLHNSDWSDSFLHAYSPNKYSWTAESHLNSAMALAIMPGFIDQLRRSGRKDVGSFVTALQIYVDRLHRAYFADFGTRKFSARAYLDEHLRFGMENVCLEPQGYLLQIASLSASRKREIYDYIRSRISDPEPVGIRTRESPLWDDRPQGEDGGIWYSLEYPLLLGVATFDREEAWRLLSKFSFARFSETYPDYWVGHWTAADEVNSTLYRPGLYAFWIPIENYRHGFQGYCSHPHTWPLYCYYRLKEQRED